MAYYGPTGFSGEAITSTVARLSWQNNSVYSELELYCFELSQYVYLYNMEDEYYWQGLSEDLTYNFSFRARYMISGEWSDYSYCPVIMSGGGSNPPSNLSLTKFHTYAELSWLSQNLEPDVIEIHRSNGDHIYSGTPLDSVPPNVEFYRDAAPLNHCWYKLRYKTDVAYSDWSAEVEYTAPSAPADVTNFSAINIRANSAVLTWTEPTTGDLPAKYEILKQVGETWPLLAILPSGWNSFLFEGLSPGVQYKVKIKSVGPGGTSAGVELIFITLSLAESIQIEKTNEPRQFRFTVGNPAEIVVFSGESQAEEGYPFQLIETENLVCRLGGELFSDNLQSGSGEVTISAIIGENEAELESTFLDFNLIGKPVLLDVVWADGTSHRIGGGTISGIKLKEHKITISYDDPITTGVGNITAEKSGDNVIPEIWGWANVKLLPVDEIKKKYKATTHRIRGIDRIWQNETILASSSYYVDYSKGEVTFSPDLVIADNDIFTATVRGQVNNLDALRDNPADILSFYFGDYFDRKLSSPMFSVSEGFTIFPVYICLDDDITASEMVGRMCRQLGLLAWQGPDGVAIQGASNVRAADIYIQDDLELIRPAEREITIDNICSMLKIRYGQNVSIPDENVYEKNYRDIGGKREFDIWGTLNDAYYLAETRFPAWDGKEKWTFSLPYILWNLWPGKVIEFETEEKIIIENIEFQFSKNQTIIGGKKL